MNNNSDYLQPSHADRRHWLFRSGMGLGGIALADLFSRNSMPKLHANESQSLPHLGIPSQGALNPTHHKPTAKRVIYLFQSGGPSQLET